MVFQLKYFFTKFSKNTFRLVLFICLLGSNSAFGLSCPQKPTITFDDLKLNLIELIRPPGLNGAQGILSFSHGKKEKIALTSGYWKNNASIFDRTNLKDLTQFNYSKKRKSGLIASVYEQNGKLWWTSYRNQVVYVTDLLGRLISTIETPNLILPVGVTGDPENGLIFIPSRGKKNALHVFRDDVEREIATLELVGMATSSYDVDFFQDCLFFVERNGAKIWTLENKEVLKALSEKNSLMTKLWRKFVGSKGLKLKVWFNDLKLPQHQSIQNGNLYVIDTEDFAIFKFDLEEGSVQKLLLPIKNIFRGLAVSVDENIFLTGFLDNADIKENRTAIFVMR